MLDTKETTTITAVVSTMILVVNLSVSLSDKDEGA